MAASIGRFGPYIRFTDKGNPGKYKFVSLKDYDPYSVTLEQALELVASKKEADANKVIHDFTDNGIQVLNGRYGPYITDGKKNVKVPKETDPKTLTLSDCETLLAAAPEKKSRRKKSPKKSS